MYRVSWLQKYLFILKWLYSSAQHFLLQSSKGHFLFYGTWETCLGRGSQRGRWLLVLHAWVKWLRCTNKTATHTDRMDAYRPLRGCLTAGEVVAAGHIPLRLHTYCTYLFTVSSLNEIPKLCFYICSFLVWYRQRFLVKVVRKWAGKMHSLTDNSLHRSLHLPSIFSPFSVSLYFVLLEWWARPLSSGWHSKTT